MGKSTKKTTGPQRANKGYENIKGQGFHTNPERINRKGRPKLLHHVNEALQQAGYEKATIGQITDNYSYLINCDEEKLKDIAADTTAPYILRKLATTLSTDKFLDVLELIMNRSYGRTKQFIEIRDADAPEPDAATPDQQKILEEVNARLADIDKEPETPS